jgi:hypothetical protein
VAKENNCGSINSAQKAGRTAKSAPKPRGKGNRKREGKQAEVVAIEDGGDASDDDGAGDDDAGDDDAGDDDAGEPVLVPKSRGKPGPDPRGKLGPKPCGKPSPKPRGKPGPQPSTKRKRTGTEVETPSSRKLRKRA